MTAREAKQLDAVETLMIGQAVVQLVASMQMLGHSSPAHSLDYRHGETDEITQFVEDFALVCKKGGGAKEARQRLVEFADSRDMMRVAMNASALGSLGKGMFGGDSK